MHGHDRYVQEGRLGTRQTLSVLVQNQPGVLMRVASVLSKNGCNVDSLAVGVTENPKYSRITLVLEGDNRMATHISNQLRKLINVIDAWDLTSEDTVSRELALIKVRADASRRQDVAQIAGIFRARIVDVAKDSLVVEVTGDYGKVDAVLSLLSEFGVLELVRTGSVTLGRGARSLHHLEREPAPRPDSSTHGYENLVQLPHARNGRLADARAGSGSTG